MTEEHPRNPEFVDTDDSFSPSPKSAPKQSLLVDIVLGLSVLNISAALVAVIWIYVSVRLAALVIIFGGFGLFAAMMARRRLVFTFLFFFVLSGYEAIVLEEYIVSRLGGHAVIDSLDNLARDDMGSVFHFKVGEPKIELAGQSTMASKAGDSRTGASFSYVVPFVEKSWTKKKPVTVFATCATTDSGVAVKVPNVASCGDYGAKYRKAVAVPESGYFRAIDNATDTHHLKVADEPLLVQFVRDPAEYIYRKQQLALWFPVGMNGLYLLLILGMAIFKRE